MSKGTFSHLQFKYSFDHIVCKPVLNKSSNDTKIIFHPNMGLFIKQFYPLKDQVEHYENYNLKLQRGSAIINMIIGV